MNDSPMLPGSKRRLSNGRMSKYGPWRRPADHATPDRYRQGCSCEPCKDAWATYKRKVRATRTKSENPTPRRKSSHATSTTLDDLLKEW